MGFVTIETVVNIDKKLTIEIESTALYTLNCGLCKMNNIDAYDWQGNHLWNIGELVGDIKMQFDGFHHISAKDVKIHYGVKCAPSHNLYACISGGFVFIIDSKKQKLLYRIAGKVR